LDTKEFSKTELENFYKKIGRNVKSIRKTKGITQLQLALAINHNSVGHIAKAELYKYGKHFNLEQLYKISKILNVDITEFFR
jgi:transcriptional regulator with XRE-family HTH domain